MIIPPEQDYVTCQICGKHFKALGYHVRIHNMTIEEYKAKFPDAKVITAEARQYLRKTHIRKPEPLPYTPAERELRKKLLAEMIVV